MIQNNYFKNSKIITIIGSMKKTKMNKKKNYNRSKSRSNNDNDHDNESDVDDHNDNDESSTTLKNNSKLSTYKNEMMTKKTPTTKNLSKSNTNDSDDNDDNDTDVDDTDDDNVNNDFSSDEEEDDDHIDHDDYDDDDHISNGNDDNDNDEYQDSTTFPTKIMICAGTYDGVLAGWEYESKHNINKKRQRDSTSSSKTDNVQLNLSFASPVHIGSVRSITIAAAAAPAAGQAPTTGTSSRPGSLLSCGYDEVLRMHDFTKRLTSSGEVKTPSDYGTPTCSSYAPPYYCSSALSSSIVQSSSSTHCIVGFSGGNIVIYKKRDWTVQHVLQGHDGGVASIAVHPSGCLALSGGVSDGKLKLWDLTKGRLSYVTKIKSLSTTGTTTTTGTSTGTKKYESIDSIVWESTEGVAYAYSYGQHITCKEVATGTDLLDVELPSRVNQIALLMGHHGMFIAAACNDGSLPVLAVQDISTISTDSTGTSTAPTERRAIMAIEPVDGPVAGEERFRCIQTLSGYYVVTANSAGVISIMNINGAIRMILSSSSTSSNRNGDNDDDDSGTEEIDDESDDNDNDDDDAEVELAVDIIESVQLGSGARITALTTWCSFDTPIRTDTADDKKETSSDKKESVGNESSSLKYTRTYQRVDDIKNDTNNSNKHKNVPTDPIALENARALVSKAKKMIQKQDKKKNKNKNKKQKQDDEIKN